MDEMCKLSNKYSKEDFLSELDASLISGHDAIESFDIEDFYMKFNKVISGKEGLSTFLIRQPDTLSSAEIEASREKATQHNLIFKLPAVIKPSSELDSSSGYFEPYTLIFSEDRKLIMLPYYGDYFSDIENIFGGGFTMDE